MSTPILIRGGRIVDPASSVDRRGDIFIENGVFRRVPSRLPEMCTVLDAVDCVVVPGLLDIHVHFREPGNEAAETLESGSKAAAAGGFTGVLAMPNTTPPIDTPAMIRNHMLRAGRLIDVHCAACITEGRKGERIADLTSLAKAGAVAFTDDGSNVTDGDILVRALRLASELGLTVLDHALDPDASGKGVMRAGTAASRAGLPGIPAEAEAVAVERDIRAAETTGGRLHIQHISTRKGVELLKSARAKGIPVSAEVTPHHLSLTDSDVNPADSSYKMSPPLGTREDMEALREALAGGVIEALATDHAPHTSESKSVGFLRAPFGAIGLETAVGVTYTDLVTGGVMDLMKWVKAWTVGPARVLGIDEPRLAYGARARVTVLDLNREWTVDPASFLSRSTNCPFAGRRLKGKARWTIFDGRIVWADPQIPEKDGGS